MATDDAETVAVGGRGGDRDRDLRRAVLAAFAAALQLLRLELQAAQKESALGSNPGVAVSTPEARTAKHRASLRAQHLGLSGNSPEDCAYVTHALQTLAAKQGAY